jgi:hypothetical protein
MAKYKPQHSRLLFIDREINTGKHPNCGSLALEWEVSPKTIQRDLDYMKYQLDAPSWYIRAGLWRGVVLQDLQDLTLYHRQLVCI